MIDKAFISNIQSFMASGGSAAQRFLKSNGNVGRLRTNDVLRKDQWEVLDAALIGIARQRLIGVNDLRSRGLVENLGGLGVLLSQYEKLSDLSDANIDFAGETAGERDSATFTIAAVPVPIFHKDFQISIRRLLASTGQNKSGQGIDRVQIDLATMKVVESMEETLFNGYSGGTVGGYSIYGYTTEPNINTDSGNDWADPTKPQINVVAAIAKEEADLFFGPYVLYVATTQFGQLRTRYTDGTGDIAFDTVKNINGIEDVRPGDRLTDGTAILVSMRSDVVDWAVGQDLTVVEWDERGGMLFNFKVMAAGTPRVKSDAAGKSGICKTTGI